MKLKRIDGCPVCGSTARTPEPKGMAAHKADAGYHYIKYAAQELGVTVRDFVTKAEVQRCGNCASVYCDPWITSELAAKVFTTGAPDHMAGWAEYESWLSSSRPTYVMERNARIAAIAEARLGKIDRYAEYGCPFQGLLPYFASLRISPPERISTMVAAMKREPDMRRPRVARWTMTVMQLARHVTAAYHWCRYLKTSCGAPPAPARTASVPTRQWLLTRDSSIFWSNNCVRYGNSCRFFATRSFGVSVLPVEEFAGDKAIDRLDLIGLFNVLDHTVQPIELLRVLMGKAKALLLVTHTAERAGKQHLYAFSDDFHAWLESELGNVICEDITAEAMGAKVRDYNCILITAGQKG